MKKDSGEWLAQAEYDLETADFMMSGGRNFYAVFMCHLALEKALKGLYQERLNEIPPKVHNLVYLINKIGIKPPENFGKFIVKLSEASVATRYPENINQLKTEYTEALVGDVINKTHEVLAWIKSQF